MTSRPLPSTLAVLLVSFGVACGGNAPAPAAPEAHRHAGHGDRHHGDHHHGDGPRAASSPQDAKLAEVAQFHGGAGPWAVAGYRMGEHALGVLGLERGSFDLEIVHYTPREVQYSCIADGAAAATGASLGKLNLTLADVPAAADTHTLYKKKSTGQSLTLRIAPSFAQRYANVPRPKLMEAGREVIALRDEEIFEVVKP